MFKKLLLIFCILGFCITAAAIPIRIGDSDDLISAGYTDHVGMDTEENVNILIELYNQYTPYPVILINEVEYLDQPEILSGRFTSASLGTQYVSFKYNGDFELWFLGGDLNVDNPLNFGTWDHALSHHREWGVEPVPEPTTLILLGSGLIGIAGVMRKKLF